MKLFPKKAFIILVLGTGLSSYVLAPEMEMEQEAPRESKVESARKERERADSELARVKEETDQQRKNIKDVRSKVLEARIMRELPRETTAAIRVAMRDTETGKIPSEGEFNKMLDDAIEEGSKGADEMEKAVDEKLSKAKSAASKAKWSHVLEKIKSFFSRSAPVEGGKK